MEDLQDGRGVRRGDHLLPHRYIKNTSTCGTTPTKHLLNAGRGSVTSQKARNSPTKLGRAKEKRKNRDKRIGMGPAPRGGSCEGGSFHTLGSPFTDGDRGWLQSHRGEHSSGATEGKAERFLHGGSLPTSTHQLERLVCLPAKTGGGWELRLWLRRSDPGERTEVA